MEKPCEHLDFDNKRDCDEEASFMCLCCGASVCADHVTPVCPYGGGTFIEDDDDI